MGWLCGVGVSGLIVFSLSLGLAQRTQNNNNNNDNNNNNNNCRCIDARGVAVKYHMTGGGAPEVGPEQCSSCIRGFGGGITVTP